MIGRCGERQLGISVLIARHDDEENNYLPIIYVGRGFGIKYLTVVDMPSTPTKPIKTKPN